MSELKSVYIARTGDWCRSENDTGKFYLKEEVDKVIAELKSDIADLRDNKVLTDDVLYERSVEIAKLTERAEFLEDKLRHRTFKLCSTLAKCCEATKNQLPFFGAIYPKEEEWFDKWHDRWLDIADKFKEAQ